MRSRAQLVLRSRCGRASQTSVVKLAVRASGELFTKGRRLASLPPHQRSGSDRRRGSRSDSGTTASSRRSLGDELSLGRKAKFGDSLRSKSEVGQFNEVLCKVIAHNLCVLIACMHEMGLEMPQFAGITSNH